MSYQIDYTTRYQIRNGRVNFANYVQRRQQVQNGNLLGLNLYPPDNDASIVPIIREGADFTTQEEYDRYLGQIATPSTPAIPANPPNAPTNLVATGGIREITISFTPGSDGGSPITNYEYYPVDASGASWVPFSPPITSSPVVISPVSNGVTRQYKLRAVNSVGSGAESVIVSGTTLNIPSAPTSLSATVGIRQVTISFTAGSDGGSAITNYKYSIDNGATYIAFAPVVTASPVTITGLTNGTTYQIKLLAVNAVDDGVESSTVSATTFNIPSAPTSLSATNGDGQVTISFTAGSNGGSAITNYKYSIDNGATYIAFAPVVTASPVTITGLTNGTTYQIKLLAVNAVDDGVESSAVSATPSATPSDAIISSLTTSLASYNAASNGDWVKITSSEYTALQTNVTGTTKAGISDSLMSLASTSGLTVVDQSAIVANTVSANTPAIAANRYLYACSIKYGKNVQATDMRIFTNTNTASVTGFNQVGSVLPGTETGGGGFAINYYVLKGVSVTNGATNGLLALFTGQTASSAVYLGFHNDFSVPNSMRYLLFTPGASGGIPNSSSSLSGSISGYGAFNIQGLTTATKQWA